MHTLLDMDEVSGPAFVSTGHLPPAERVDTLLGEAYERFKSVDEGKVADYIPALARTPRHLFAVCVVETNGALHATGDTDYEFSIQSVSKPFVFALVCQAVGEGEARKKLGVNATGLPFNSVMAIELNSDRTMNPMVNAGAIATTSLQSGPRRHRGGQMAIHPRRVVPVRRPQAHPQHRGLPVRGRHQLSQPRDSQAARGLRPPVFRRARGDRHLHPTMLSECQREGFGGDGRDLGRRRP